MMFERLESYLDRLDAAFYVTSHTFSKKDGSYDAERHKAHWENSVAFGMKLHASLSLSGGAFVTREGQRIAFES